MLSVGRPAQQEEATIDLVKLIKDTPAANAEEIELLLRVVPPLVALARDGTEGQKERAALVLAAYNAESQGAIREAGGVAPLVALARAGTEKQAENAARALAAFAKGGAANQAALRAAGGLAPLVALVRKGTEEQKMMAAGALASAARGYAENQAAIAREGGIAPLVALASCGVGSSSTEGLRAWAAGDALKAVSEGNAENLAAWDHCRVEPWVVLLSTRPGEDAARKEEAIMALWKLMQDAVDADARAKNTRDDQFRRLQNAARKAGGVPPLVALARSGTQGQKKEAAFALETLAVDNEENQAAIAAAYASLSERRVQ